jgi:hypothetical protein
MSAKYRRKKRIAPFLRQCHLGCQTFFAMHLRHHNLTANVFAMETI